MEPNHTHSLFLVTSATIAILTIPTLVRLTCIDWKSPKHHIWSSAADFRRPNITINFEVLGDIDQVSLSKVVTHLADLPSLQVFLFVNLLSDCRKWTRKLSKLTSRAQLTILMLNID